MRRHHAVATFVDCSADIFNTGTVQPYIVCQVRCAEHRITRARRHVAGRAERRELRLRARRGLARFLEATAAAFSFSPSPRYML